MGLTIEEMQTNIIRRYGFEHPTTIRFFQYCEKETDLGCIQLVYEFDIDEKKNSSIIKKKYWQDSTKHDII